MYVASDSYMNFLKSSVRSRVSHIREWVDGMGPTGRGGGGGWMAWVNHLASKLYIQ